MSVDADDEISCKLALHGLLGAILGKHSSDAVDEGEGEIREKLKGTSFILFRFFHHFLLVLLIGSNVSVQNTVAERWPAFLNVASFDFKREQGRA